MKFVLWMFSLILVSSSAYAGHEVGNGNVERLYCVGVGQLISDSGLRANINLLLEIMDRKKIVVNIVGPRGRVAYSKDFPRLRDYISFGPTNGFSLYFVNKVERKSEEYAAINVRIDGSEVAPVESVIFSDLEVRLASRQRIQANHLSCRRTR